MPHKLRDDIRSLAADLIRRVRGIGAFSACCVLKDPLGVYEYELRRPCAAQRQFGIESRPCQVHCHMLRPSGDTTRTQPPRLTSRTRPTSRYIVPALGGKQSIASSGLRCFVDQGLPCCVARPAPATQPLCLDCSPNPFLEGKDYWPRAHMKHYSLLQPTR